MKLEFGYGNGIETVNVPEENLLGVLLSNEVEHERRGAEAVEYALENPIASARLAEIVKCKARSLGANSPDKAEAKDAAREASELSVVIITSDISRPLPSYDVLPTVLDELYAAGVKASNISVILARGSHRHHTEEEKKKLVGERCYNELNVIDSDTEDCVHLGITSRGTCVDYDRRVVEADFRICLGNVEFHYFAGYSGGYKAIMPGVSTPEAIQTNHRMMISPDACAGKLEGNPLREDIEEAGAMLGVDFIVNCVLDEHKKIVYAAAGDVTEAHRNACRYLDNMYRKPLEQRADIVIVSQGGAPKDASLYQTQKALDNSKYAVKDGGTIILIGACKEGFGNATFEQWIKEAKCSRDLVDRIHKEFKLGGHKAAAIAMVLDRADILLVSELEDETVREAFMTPMKSAEEAFRFALKKHGPDATIIAMPFGGAVLPMPVE